MNPAPTFLFVSLLLLGQTSCDQFPNEGRFCRSDNDCDHLCSRIGECLPENGALDLRAHWTVNRVAPTPAEADVCGPIANMELRLESDSRRDREIVYFPIPCQLGQVFYDRMPKRFVNLSLAALDENENAIEVLTQRIDEGSNDITFNFKF